MVDSTEQKAFIGRNVSAESNVVCKHYSFSFDKLSLIVNNFRSIYIDTSPVKNVSGRVEEKTSAV
jgi:hypothetical protein